MAAQELVRVSFSGLPEAARRQASRGVLGQQLQVCDSAEATHLVVQPPVRRTLKLLHALARGAWVVSPAWLSDSSSAHRPLDPAPYELVDDVPGCRIARLRADSGRPGPLAGLRVSFSPSTTTVPCAELRVLLAAAGASVALSRDDAPLRVCREGDEDDRPLRLTESDLLDAVTRHERPSGAPCGDRPCAAAGRSARDVGPSARGLAGAPARAPALASSDAALPPSSVSIPHPSPHSVSTAAPPAPSASIPPPSPPSVSAPAGSPAAGRLRRKRAALVDGSDGLMARRRPLRRRENESGDSRLLGDTAGEGRAGGGGMAAAVVPTAPAKESDAEDQLPHPSESKTAASAKNRHSARAAGAVPAKALGASLPVVAKTGPAGINTSGPAAPSAGVCGGSSMRSRTSRSAAGERVACGDRGVEDWIGAEIPEGCTALVLPALRASEQLSSRRYFILEEALQLYRARLPGCNVDCGVSGGCGNGEAKEGSGTGRGGGGKGNGGRTGRKNTGGGHSGEAKNTGRGHSGEAKNSGGGHSAGPRPRRRGPRTFDFLQAVQDAGSTAVLCCGGRVVAACSFVEHETDETVTVTGGAISGEGAVTDGAMADGSVHDGAITDGAMADGAGRRMDPPHDQPGLTATPAADGARCTGFAEITLLAVARGRSRRGLGSALLRLVESWLRRRGVRYAAACAGLDCADFWRKAGYSAETELLTRWWAVLTDPFAHSRVMSRAL